MASLMHSSAEIVSSALCLDIKNMLIRAMRYIFVYSLVRQTSTLFTTLSTVSPTETVTHIEDAYSIMNNLLAVVVTVSKNVRYLMWRQPILSE